MCVSVSMCVCPSKSASSICRRVVLDPLGGRPGRFRPPLLHLVSGVLAAFYSSQWGFQSEMVLCSTYF